ncbi:unnamed protein product [Chrysoparadoxa australica]
MAYRSGRPQKWLPGQYMAMIRVPTKSRPRFAAFKVSPSMTKWEVKETLLKVYGVHVKNVTTQNFLGKRSMVRGPNQQKISFKRADYKKAFVTIDLERMAEEAAHQTKALEGGGEKKAGQVPVSKGWKSWFS